MNKIAFGSLFVLLAVIATTTIPSAFADHVTASVSIPAGTSVPGCEETDTCWDPSTVTVDVGGEVTWSNDDTAAHTVTSGTPEEGPDGVFDSGLFMAGNTFAHKFDAAGEFKYFCMVHPWMQGVVVVEEAMGEEMEEEMMEEPIMLQTTSTDGSIMVEITASGPPIAGEAMMLDVKFSSTSTGAMTEHINYDILATQGGEIVLDESGNHKHEGRGSHTTIALASADPVDVAVTIQGIGIDPPFSGPIGDVVGVTVVPEFGTITLVILGVALVSIIAFTAKTKLVPRI